MSTITRVRNALQALHREELMPALAREDTEYAIIMNSMFELLERLEMIE